MNLAPTHESRVVITGNLIETKMVKNRSIAQIVIEVPIETANEILSPMTNGEQPVAVVLLDKPATLPSGPTSPTGRSLAQQSGIHCSKQAFQCFLSEKLRRPIDNEQSAASAVREVCEVASRREFDESDAAARNWKALRGEFQAWRIMG
jgi:hypothetical protein